MGAGPSLLFLRPLIPKLMFRILSALFLLCTLQTFAQKGSKMITVEDLWQKGTFRLKTVPGFNAMKDGVRYTQLDVIAGGQQQVNTYDLASGKKGENLFDSKEATF